LLDEAVRKDRRRPGQMAPREHRARAVADSKPCKRRVRASVSRPPSGGVYSTLVTLALRLAISAAG
jgi:hypothetical protein